MSLLTRGITDLAWPWRRAGADAGRLARGRRGHEREALLIVLMAGTEIFRPLRDLRSVLHQGMLGQSAAASIHMLMDARPLTPPLSADRAAPPRSRPPSNSDNVAFAYTPERPAHQA